MTGTERRALRRVLLIGLSVAALGATGCARRAYAGGTVTYSGPAVSGQVVVQQPLPQPRVVVNRPPVPFAGAVWVNGHYEWSGSQYVWVEGYYVQPRVGYVFVQPHWTHRHGRYVFYRGGWSQGGRVVHHVSPRHRVVVRGQRPHHRGSVRVRAPRRGSVRVEQRRGAVRVQPSRRGAVRVQTPSHRGSVRVQTPSRRGSVRVESRGSVRAAPSRDRRGSTRSRRRGRGSVRVAPPRGNGRGHGGRGRGSVRVRSR